MENENTLDHLLKIEAEAAALVNDAQAEADRRIHDNEEKMRAAYEERFKVEAQGREASLKIEKEKLKEQYQDAIDEYGKEISGINVDVERFTSLFNKYIAGEG
jgi:F0F1-type ATP synthase membrane subunit b/b'